MTILEDEKKEDEEKKEPQQIIMLGGSDTDIRTVALYGDVTEELAKEVVSGIWYLRATAKAEEPIDIEDPETDYQEVIRPIEMVISTNGGNADDMFAIYDVMRLCREEVDIETLGIGKVMSAGTLLLAAGTKGKRKIGKHCRVMIHSVIGGSIGPMHQLDNEMKEVKAIQESYIRAICEETNLTERKLRALLKKKVNIYLTAEEAVKHGFADIII
jgi:ATP-dependent Clp protease protease subunit